MNLKILVMLLMYYGFISLFFFFAGDSLIGYSTNVNLTRTAMNPDELEQGGFFTTGVSLTRFAGFVLFGVGLPSTTPLSIRTVFVIWQSLVTILSIGFVLSSIWDG